MKKKLQGKLPRWKLLCFIFDDASQKLWTLYWILLSFHLFKVVMYMQPFQNLIPYFPYVNNLVNWNNNKLLLYVWLVGWRGARIKCLFTFMHDMFWRFGIHIWWKKSWTMKCIMQYWKTFVLHVHAHWIGWKHSNLHKSWEN